MTPIERWRQRVWDGVHRGTGVERGKGTRPAHVKRGLQRALDRVGSITDALLALQLLATDLGWIEATIDGRRDSTARGVRLAVFWLRQEIEREEPGAVSFEGIPLSWGRSNYRGSEYVRLVVELIVPGPLAYERTDEICSMVERRDGVRVTYTPLTGNPFARKGGGS